MYYYYSYYGQYTNKLTIELRFRHEDGADAVSIYELNEFLEKINELHKRLIYLTQPEYKLPANLDEFEKYGMLDYHDLKIVDIQRENPFLLKLVFDVSFGFGKIYLAIWKLLLFFCKKYGKTLDELKNNTSDSWNIVKEFFSAENKQFELEHKLSEILDELPDLTEKKIIEKNLIRVLNAFFENEKTKIIYNYFCVSIFTIDKLTCSLDRFNYQLIEE